MDGLNRWSVLLLLGVLSAAMMPQPHAEAATLATDLTAVVLPSFEAVDGAGRDYRLGFRLGDAVPAQAKILDVSVRLRLQARPGASPAIELRAVGGIDTCVQGASTGPLSPVPVNGVPEAVELTVKKNLSPGDGLCLELSLPGRAGDQRILFGSGPQADAAGYRPRLVVGYRMPDLVADRRDWPQAGADAQHSSRSDWVAEGQPVAMALRGIYPPRGESAVIMTDPLMYAGALVFAAKASDTDCGNRNCIVALDGNGRRLWSRALADPVAASAPSRLCAARDGRETDLYEPRYTPAIDGNGLLYVPTVNRLFILDLAADGAVLESCAWPDLLPGARTLRTPPTIGDNGTLYLSSDLGVYALSPYRPAREEVPADGLRLLWRYPVGGDRDRGYGRVTLGPGESSAYFIDAPFQHVHGRAPRLLTIDTRDGTVLSALEVAVGLKQGGGDRTAVELPVAAVAPGGERYVLSGRAYGERLTVVAAGEARVIEAVELGGAWLSPVVIGAEGDAFFLVSGDADSQTSSRLCRLGASAPRCETLTEAAPAAKSSVLLADGGEGIYAFDRDHPQAALLLTTDPKRFRRITLWRTEGKAPGLKDNLLLAPHGALYLRNDNRLFQLEPTRIEGPVYRIDGPVLRHKTAYLSDGKVVAGGVTRVVSGSSAVIQAGTAVGLGAGFRVEPGARLVIRVGIPQPGMPGNPFNSNAQEGRRVSIQHSARR